MRLPLRGALAGLLVGFALLGILAGMALFKNSPGGLGENQMWFGLFATLWGLPMTAIADAVVSDARYSLLAILITVPLNWAALGFLAASLVTFLRGRRR